LQNLDNHFNLLADDHENHMLMLINRCLLD